MNDISPSAPPPPAAASSAANSQAKWLMQIRSGSSWIFWISGLSIINSIISLFEGNLTFVVGLGISQLIEAVGFLVAEEVPNSALLIQLIALALSVVPALVLAALGYFARKGKTWAFVITAVAYSLDMILVFIFADWVGGIFHILALFYIIRGAVAISNLRKAVAGTL